VKLVSPCRADQDVQGHDDASVRMGKELLRKVLFG
jgi:hypothetical protein